MWRRFLSVILFVNYTAVYVKFHIVIYPFPIKHIFGLGFVARYDNPKQGFKLSKSVINVSL